MPYGLFDYGGTIQTMGLSPTYDGIIKFRADDLNDTRNYTLMAPEDPSDIKYTRAFPEDPKDMVKVRADDLPPVGTARYPEDPSTPITMAFPEDPSDIYKIKADDAPPSGGCPKGYEPTSQQSSQPIAGGGAQFYKGSGNTMTDMVGENGIYGLGADLGGLPAR